MKIKFYSVINTTKSGFKKEKHYYHGAIGVFSEKYEVTKSL